MNIEASQEILPCPLSKTRQCFYITAAFILVAFGQPAWIASFGTIASIAGYAIFWRALLCQPTALGRFWLSAAWFFAVQLVQLSWFISHPYLYIYAVYFLLSLILGLQFGILGIFISPKILKRPWHIVSVAALWTLLEWSRIFIFSGFPFSPVGMALAGNTYSLQTASIGGIFGLSFWVILTNLLLLRAWVKSWLFSPVFFYLATALFPYAYGVGHIYLHEKSMEQNTPGRFKAVLVQTAFPAEEAIDFDTPNGMVNYVIGEWRQILEILKKQEHLPIDLIALPEFVVPFGTYANVYPLNIVEDIFQDVFGPDSLTMLPLLSWPFGSMQTTKQGQIAMVNNAYWAQSVANYFHASVLAGLEDAEDTPSGTREYYSAAILFHPQKTQETSTALTKLPLELDSYFQRYEKRILVPMGEYIPFAFCKGLAQQYGVFGSFTPGTEAKVMVCNNVSFSPSICYEEAFSGIMSEGRQKGAEMLVNLTNDAWYPHSRLPRQHFEHARLRTVENGVPLLRACNTGITAAVDSLGRTAVILGGEEPETAEWISDSLYVDIPTYAYTTLYSRYGDMLIVGLCFIAMIIGFFIRC